jgi:hypothetical protein
MAVARVNGFDAGVRSVIESINPKTLLHGK